MATKKSKVMDAEIVQQSTALATATPRPDGALVLSPVMNLEVAKKRLAEFQEFVKFYLQEGEDFGVIPGTNKPTLYKPGADKLCELYGLGDSYRILTQVEDFTADPPLFDYTIECQLWRGDRLVSTGLGSCNSYESKYKMRELQRICPACGKTAIIKGKEDYGGGWLCWKKRDGCGAKFKDGDVAIEGQDAGKIFNDDIPTLKNTILKMAKKRAKVDGTLAATRSSGVFTQDMEDISGIHEADRDTGSKEKAQEVAARKIAEHNANKGTAGNMGDSGAVKPPQAKEATKSAPSQPHNPMAAVPAKIPDHVQVVLIEGDLEMVGSTRTNGAPLMTSQQKPYVVVYLGGEKYYAFANHKMSLNGKDEEPLHDILKRLPRNSHMKFTAHKDAKGYWNVDRVLQLGDLEWSEGDGMSVLRRGEIPGQAKLL